MKLLTLVLFIVVGVVVLTKVAPFEHYVVDKEVIERLEIENVTQERECSLTLNNDKILVGEKVIGQIVAAPNSVCDIYLNPGAGWTKVISLQTDSNGNLEYEDTMPIKGAFGIKSICGECTTNLATLNVY